jgi:Ni/Fe-hydrogenase subunit HybB-like protein
MFISFGLIAIELAAYIAIVKFFPILSGASPAGNAPKPGGALAS